MWPYSESFEEHGGGWLAYGSNSSWAHGEPGLDLAGTPDGELAWVTNPSGNYNNLESSFVESPCLNFSSASEDPVLVFQHNYLTESCCDEGWLEMSTDGGESWLKVLAGPGAVNWYNDTSNHWWDGNSGGWREARVELTGTAGLDDVRLRFALSSDGSVVSDGFAFDHVRVSEPPE